MTKEQRLKKRHSSEKRFRFYGLASIFVALLFVLILVNNIFSKGSSAFMKTAIDVEVFFDPELLELKNGANEEEILEADFYDVTIETLLKVYPANTLEEENALIDLLSKIINNSIDVNLYSNLLIKTEDNIKKKAYLEYAFVHDNYYGTGTYTTPAGGFTTAANINTIMANLVSKVAGYSDAYRGLYLVIENTDLVGFVQAQVSNGFSFADAALNNGWFANYMGVDIHVIRSGTFVDATLGTRTVTNDGHRVFGVKNVTTYAAPRGIQMEEKGVTGKTGKEVVVFGYIGFKAWTPKASLTVDITLA